MRLALCMLLVGCGESATFEEVAPEEEAPVEEVTPEGSEKAPELEAPVDARPDEFEAEAKRPQPGQAWPPIVVPEGQRERNWEWDFKNKGSTKRATEKKVERKARDMTSEEAAEMELKQQGELERPDWAEVGPD